MVYLLQSVTICFNFKVYKNMHIVFSLMAVIVIYIFIDFFLQNMFL